MTDELKRKRAENLFEAMLKVAVEETVDRKLASLPSNEELNKMFPPTVADEKILKIIADEKRKSKRQQSRKTLMKIASFAGIFFTISTTALITVEASRNFILNTIINIQADHVAFEFAGGGLKENLNLPVGFEYMGSQVTENFSVSTYLNADGKQIIVQQHNASSIGTGIDTDYREFSTIYIKEQEVFLFESIDGVMHNVIMWQQDNVVFQVFANINIEEMISLIKNLINYPR